VDRGEHPTLITIGADAAVVVPDPAVVVAALGPITPNNGTIGPLLMTIDRPTINATSSTTMMLENTSLAETV
jgi:hypothetical protein